MVYLLHGMVKELDPSVIHISHSTFVLPNGVVLKKVEPLHRACLAALPVNPADAIPRSALAEIVYRADLQSEVITVDIARGYLGTTIRYLNTKILADAQASIENAAPQYEIVDKKKRRVEPRYYLTTQEQAQQAQAEGASQAAPRPEAEQPLVLSGGAAAIFQNLRTLPPHIVREIYEQCGRSTKQVTTELATLARKIAEVQAATPGSPNAAPSIAEYAKLSLLPASAKVDPVARSLLNMLATIIPPEGHTQQPPPSVKWKLGHITRQIAHVVGTDEAPEIIQTALANLPKAGSIVLRLSLSINLKDDLWCLDIDECDEAQMVQYIGNAVYKWGRNIRGLSADDILPDAVVQRLELLINTCLERSAPFQTRLVIERLLTRYETDNVFRRMIAAAHQGEFLDSLQCFFQEHEDTQEMARACDKLLGNEPMSMQDILRSLDFFRDDYEDSEKLAESNWLLRERNEEEES